MYLFGLWFSLDICPVVGLLDCMVALSLVFCFNKFIYFFIFTFGCVGSSLLRAGFL